MITAVLSLKSKPVHAWRELAAFLYLPADVIWLTGWYCLVTDGSTTQPIFGVYLVFVMTSCLAYLILRLLLAWQAPIALRLGLGALGLLAGLWLGESLLVYQTLIFDFNSILQDIWISFRGSRALAVEFWSLACIIFIWVRSILYTHNPVTQDTIMSRLQFGLFMMLILILIYNKLGLIIVMSGLCLFLILGLSSLGLARIADINLYRGGRRLLFSWDWFLVICGISAGLVLIASTLSLLTGSWLSLVVIALTTGIITIIRFIVVKLVVPLVNIVLAILYFLLELFYNVKSLGQVKAPDLTPYFNNKDFEPFELTDPTGVGLKAAQPYLLGILLGVVAVGIVLMLLRLPNKEGLGDADGAGEKTGGNAFKQLRKLINQGIQHALERFSKQVNLRRVASLFRAARIRWIYQQFELRSARKGYPRLAAVTPMEFQAIVSQYFVGGENDIALLTAAYQSVRYGELPETPQEVTRVVVAWDHLKKLKVERSDRPTRRRKP
jgi:hypothetical protein